MANVNTSPVKNPMPMQDPVLRARNFDEVTLGYDEQTATALLDSFESSLANRFDVNPGEGYDLATAAESTGTMMAMLLPMLLSALDMLL